MSVNGHEQPGLPDWSEPRVPKVRLTHRNIHFLIAPGDVAMQASVIVGLSHRNHPSGLNEALRSAMAQDMAPERQVEALSALPGFDTYYGELMRSLHPACALDTDKEVPIPEPSAHPDVTLLIKCCPQDASSAHLQVQHLVSELGMRARFAKRVLLIDPFEGPYLRQFAEGDLSALRVAASQLHQSGFIDEVWVAPTDPVERFHLKDNWFSSRTGYVMTGSSGLATTPCLSASTLGFIARLRQRGLGRFKTAILRDECEGLAQVIPLWFGGGGRGRFDNGLRVAQGWQRRFVGHALADCLLIGDDLIDWIADGL